MKTEFRFTFDNKFVMHLSHVSPARFFALIAALFGVVLVFITPPFQSPDEYNHFFRAFQVSEGHWYPEKQNNNRLGGNLPHSLDSLKIIFLPLKGNYAAKTSLSAVQQALSLPLDEADRRFLDFPNTAIYAPTAYIPQAIGIAFARYFTGRCLVLFYAARLANLLFWTALLWAALQRMPFQRQSMAFLALLPASLAIAASCNADVLTNGLAFYAIAVFCAALTPGAVLRPLANRPREGVAMGIVVLMALQKLILAPMALLAGLSALESTAHWKTAFRRSFYPLLLALAVAFWWGWTAQNWFVPYDRYEPAVRDVQTLNPGVDPSAQLACVLKHPFVFTETVVVSFFRAAPSMAAHFVGKFGWEKNYLPGWMICLLWAGLAALVFSEKNRLSPAQRLWAAGIVLVCIALWAVTMYALWCPVGARALDNWQGRYFVPLSPLVILATGAGWGQRVEKWVTPVSVLILLAGNISLIIAVLERY